MPTEVCNLLGLAGYYRLFIQDFYRIASPLMNLTQNNVRFLWTEDCERAFRKLKQRLTTAHVLTIHVIGGRLVVFTDASREGLGCVLQKKDRLIPYAS